MYAQELHDTGCTVVPVEFFVRRAKDLRERLEREFMHFPEFIHHPSFDDCKKVAVTKESRKTEVARRETEMANELFGSDDESDQSKIDRYKSTHPNVANKHGMNLYGLGGTAFIGSPSVFHNRVSREIRTAALLYLVPLVFSPYVHKYLNNHYRLEVVPDRVMVRPTGDSASSESWHRDEAPGASADDHVFGGWVNLDYPRTVGKHTVTGNQTFSCVLGTHKNPSTAKGFAPLNASEKAHFSELKKEGKTNEIIIPPGHVLIFAENLVHEVVGNTKPFTTVRQFLGWALTKRTQKSILLDIDGRRLDFTDIKKLCNDNAVIPLKSGQYPPVYPKVYHSQNMAQRTELARFLAYNLKPNAMRYTLRDQRRMIGNHPTPYGRPVTSDFSRSLKSLKEMGELGHHPKYAPYELHMLMPNSRWKLLDPDGKEVDLTLG